MGRRSFPRNPLITLLAALAARALGLAACGDDDIPDSERDSARDRTSDTARDKGGIMGREMEGDKGWHKDADAPAKP